MASRRRSGSGGSRPGATWRRTPPPGGGRNRGTLEVDDTDPGRAQVCRFCADLEDAVTAFREAFPIVYVDDVPRAIDFYVSTLDFEVGFRWPADGEPTFAFLRLAPL